MLLAPWRTPLSRALHRNRSRAYSRYLQLATVTPSGFPTNRTVVFRGFLSETNCLTFVTDSRSEKVHHLKANPATELCWYFPDTREQFRLSGQTQMIAAATPEQALGQIRQKTWEDLSENARQQFAWPHPGHPREAEGFERRSHDPHAPLENFTVLIFDPDWVDHLELRGAPQNRYCYQRHPDDGWQVSSVNP